MNGRYPLFSLLVFGMLFAGCISSKPAPTSPALSANELTTIQARGTLVIATDPDYPPQSELLKGTERAPSTRCAANEYTANQMQGFDISVGLEISQRLGVEPCFTAPTWTQIISGGWDGRWDVSIGSMAITTERMQTLYFSQPYISGAAAVFVHNDNHGFSRPADLSGKKIGVCAGCAYEAYLKGTLQIPGEKMDLVITNAQTMAYDTDTSALADLAQGDGVRLDAVITDPDTGRIAIQQGLPIRQLEPLLYHDYSAVAFDRRSNQNPQPLIERITAIIQSMHQDGTLPKLSNQVYHGDFTTPASQYDIRALKQFSDSGENTH